MHFKKEQWNTNNIWSCKISETKVAYKKDETPENYQDWALIIREREKILNNRYDIRTQIFIYFSVVPETDFC